MIDHVYGFAGLSVGHFRQPSLSKMYEKTLEMALPLFIEIFVSRLFVNL